MRAFLRLLVLCMFWCGCACIVVGCGLFGTPTAEEAARRAQRTQLILQDIADEYAMRVMQASDEMSDTLESARERQILSRQVLATVTACAAIPSGANPGVGIVDMIVMMTLNYEVGQRTIPRDFGDRGAPLLEAYKWGYERVWRAAEQKIPAEYLTELRELIDRWKEENPGADYVTLVRFEDFLNYATVGQRTRSSGGGNIFSLLLIDPFAGLEPSTREIRETRLFAERALFYAQRLPGLLSLEFQHTIDTLAASPTGENIAKVLESGTSSAEQIASVADELPRTIEREREAGLNQISELVTRERTAAIEQLGEEFGEQTDRLIERIESDQSGLRETVVEVRATVESATALSESLRTTIDAAEKLRGPSGGDGGGESLDLEQLNATILSAQSTVQELNKLVSSLGGMLDSDQWGDREEEYRRVLADTEEAGERLVDRAFSRLLVLAGVVMAGLVVVVLVAKLVGRRGS